MTNVSSIKAAPITTKPVAPTDARPASLVRPGVEAAPRDAFTPSDDAQSVRRPEAEPAYRADLVEQMKERIAAGELDDTITDERLDAILPGLLEDLRNL
jgi:anti-sigma28 factor (negative regulator of flagellin synthesis)